MRSGPNRSQLIARLMVGLRSRLKAWRASRLARSVAVLAGGTALGQGLVVLSSPLLTRLYTPDDIGVLTAYVSILSIVVVVATLRYEIAIPLPEDDGAAANLLAVSLVALGATSLLAGLGVWGLAGRLVQWAGNQRLGPCLWLIPPGLAAVGLYEATNLWCLRRRAFSCIASTKLGQNAGMVLSQVGLGLLRAGPAGLLVGDVLGRLCGAVTMVALVLSRDRDAFRRISPARMREVAGRYRRFPLMSSGASLLNSLGNQAPLFLLALMYGTTVTGWVALAQRVLVLPLNLVANSAARVYLAEAAAAVQARPEQLPRLLKSMLASMFALAFPYVAALAVLGPAVFPVVFGNSWGEAGVYARMLAAMVLFQNIASPVSGTLDVLERQDLNLVGEIARAAVMLGAVALASHLHLAPRLGVALLSVAGAVSQLVLLGSCIYAVRAWRMRAHERSAGRQRTGAH